MAVVAATLASKARSAAVIAADNASHAESAAVVAASLIIVAGTSLYLQGVRQESAARQANSRALVVQSSASDIYSLLTGVKTTLSDLDSQVNAGVSLTAGAAQAVADEFLNRNLAGGGSGNTRNVRNALRPMRNKTEIDSNVVRIYAEDDTSVAWSAAVSTAAGNPIVSIDP
jgi:hypothetical protein